MLYITFYLSLWSQNRQRIQTLLTHPSTNSDPRPSTYPLHVILLMHPQEYRRSSNSGKVLLALAHDDVDIEVGCLCV